MADRKEGPVDQPSMANGAHITLEDFQLPTFPREAGGLLALTLTSLIKASKYNEALKSPWKMTSLPRSIQSLTLERFVFGYPTGFLAALIGQLPELRSLVVYSQRFTGLTQDSSDDAVAFIKGAQKLRALHLLDAEISPSFVKGIEASVKELEKPLMFIEINFTDRGDLKMLESIPAAELPLLVHQGLISCSFNISPAETNRDWMGEANDSLDGIRTMGIALSERLVERLTDEETAPKVMKHLNLTLYSISPQQLSKILYKHKGLMVLNVSIEVRRGSLDMGDLLEMLTSATNLEQVEIVLCPDTAIQDLNISIEEEALAKLSQVCKKLTSLKVNQQRCQRTRTSIECTLMSGKWQLAMSEPKTDMADNTKSKKPRSKHAWSPWT